MVGAFEEKKSSFGRSLARAGLELTVNSTTVILLTLDSQVDKFACILYIPSSAGLPSGNSARVQQALKVLVRGGRLVRLQVRFLYCDQSGDFLTMQTSRQ